MASGAVLAMLVAGCGGEKTQPSAASGSSTCAASTTTLQEFPDRDERRHDSDDEAGYTISVTNNGEKSCTLFGYPRVVAYSAENPREPLDQEVTHDGWFAPDPGPQPTTLEPGRSAYFELGWYQGGSASGHRIYVLQFGLPGKTAMMTQKIELGASIWTHFSVTAFAARPLLLTGEPFDPDGYSAVGTG